MSKESQTYQNMLEEVEKLLGELGSQNVDLDAMVKKVERGYDLISSMRDRLDDVKGKIEKLHSDYEAKLES